MTTRKRRATGLTPIENATWTVPETGQPIPKSPTPHRRRSQLSKTNPLTDRSTPARADLRALHDEVLGAPSASERASLAAVAASIHGKELRAEYDRLNRELAELCSVIRAHRNALPGRPLPAGVVANAEKLIEALVANAAKRARVRHALAPGMPEIPPALSPRDKQHLAEAKKLNRVLTLEARQRHEAELEAARRQGRREYAAVSGLLASAGSSPASRGAARADVRHPDHAVSQRVRFQGRPSMIFTGR